MPENNEPFFVGWGKVPKGLYVFLAMVSCLLVAGFVALSYATASTQTDTYGGAYMGPAKVIGQLQHDPYPVLHVLESEQFPTGATIILSGSSKTGAFEQAVGLDGQIVEANGIRMDRGDLAGLQLRNGTRGLRLIEDQSRASSIDVEHLGRWKLQGEICDGKCLNGSMRPGRGLAHRACAALCLLGDVAPVFVAASEVDGSEFLLLSDPSGGVISPELFEYTALFIEAEGDVERHGDLLVFKLAPETVKLLK